MKLMNVNMFSFRLSFVFYAMFDKVMMIYPGLSQAEAFIAD